jgi:hypothetical protein
MTLQEFKDEFKFKYDAASNGGPDIDDYEMSLVLTQAVKDITDLAILKYEEDEDSRRLISHILKYHESIISEEGVTSGIRKNKVSLPEKLMRIVREEPKLENCIGFPEVFAARIDEINTLINNSFKKPTKRKVLKIEREKGFITVFSSVKLTNYKITYIPEIVPIIVSDLTELGDYTVEGLSDETETVLPAYIHDKIVDVAVARAIRIVRTNTIATQRQ